MPMTKEDLIISVGREQYNVASRELTRIASSEDYGNHNCPAIPEELDLGHDLSPQIWDSQLSEQQKLALFFQVYDDLPSGGMVMYAYFAYAELSPEGRKLWWKAVQERLVSGNRALSSPLCYYLWCNYFENPKTVLEAWSALTGSKQESLLRVVLPISGPVPWDLKLPVYETAINAPSLRLALYDGLLGSAFDYFGKIEPLSARRILLKLDLPSDTISYGQLLERLSIEEQPQKP
ncbi:MAG TPA: hypothetical protein VGT03_12565 [Candidatus Acidoferrales bacterium]|nr:hypothetical protein [Candidatus Acidoferrales bacterium]